MAEVRKLKVSELRAELRERGLDPKGLKAELVARLLSAIETTEPNKSADLPTLDTEPVETTEETPEPTCQTESTSTSATTAVTASGDTQQTLEQNQSGSEGIWTKPCVDQSTQTDSDTAASISQSVCSSCNRRKEAEQFNPQSEEESTPMPTSQHCKSLLYNL